MCMILLDKYSFHLIVLSVQSPNASGTFKSVELSFQMQHHIMGLWNVRADAR